MFVLALAVALADTADTGQSPSDTAHETPHPGASDTADTATPTTPVDSGDPDDTAEEDVDVDPEDTATSDTDTAVAEDTAVEQPTPTGDTGSPTTFPIGGTGDTATDTAEEDTVSGPPSAADLAQEGGGFSCSSLPAGSWVPGLLLVGLCAGRRRR